jgi:predicted NBD/HSP70 family sugar kinase
MPLYAPDSTHRKVDLQDLVGGPAVLALAHEHGVAGDTPTEVVSRAAADPEASAPFLGQLADRVAVGLAAVVAVLDPPLVVLAGQVAQAGGEVLRDAVAAAMRRNAPLECAIAATTIPDDAVLLGALDAGLAAVRESLLTNVRTGVSGA